MNRTSIMIAAALLTLPVAARAQTAPALAPVPREFPREIAPSKIILVGDSTTAVVGGWGPSFCAYHVTSFMACLNLARGGRSSRTYMQERSWELALNEARVPGYQRTWVLIQFGHNDQPGKTRSTELAQEFPGYIRRYVDDARRAGAIPVLLTPLTRRTFRDARLDNDLEPWAAAIRTVAKEADVPLIDLNAASAAAVQTMGERAAERFAQLPPGAVPPAAPAPTASPSATEVNVIPTALPKLAFDRTHLGVEGADYFAEMVAELLADAVPDMRPLLFVDRLDKRAGAAPSGR
ncbi:rhamnogalacturonan acetylesterase [Sphingomonas sp. BGYR3]|uniref:rhamnogalacturonan acetylesterase n=1 Tax=Sphingomonas sp. BGYR3 TaxID=2975483 RepID=UPI0021A7B156|nr:rhamnogalacturonan acetylesterase [Sphingomonas sp. BGYR3]MDG5489695.1 rhamnogalacturonan acetylesterase [Sphingomonas sp. BGYR3]